MLEIWNTCWWHITFDSNQRSTSKASKGMWCHWGWLGNIMGLDIFCKKILIHLLFCATFFIFLWSLWSLYNTTWPHLFWKSLHQLFDKYTAARTEHDALVKSSTKIFSNFVAFSENPNFTTIQRELNCLVLYVLYYSTLPIIPIV